MAERQGAGPAAQRPRRHAVAQRSGSSPAGPGTLLWRGGPAHKCLGQTCRDAPAVVQPAAAHTAAWLAGRGPEYAGRGSGGLAVARGGGGGRQRRRRSAEGGRGANPWRLTCAKQGARLPGARGLWAGRGKGARATDRFGCRPPARQRSGLRSFEVKARTGRRSAREAPRRHRSCAAARCRSPQQRRMRGRDRGIPPGVPFAWLCGAEHYIAFELPLQQSWPLQAGGRTRWRHGAARPPGRHLGRDPHCGRESKQ